MDKDELQVMGNDVFIAPSLSLGEAVGLCPDQRFTAQPTAGDCSGTLVDNRIVLTAGHCVEGKSCSDISFVFDYAYYGLPRGRNRPRQR